MEFICGNCKEVIQEIKTSRYDGGAIPHEKCGSITTFAPIDHPHTPKAIDVRPWLPKEPLYPRHHCEQCGVECQVPTAERLNEYIDKEVVGGTFKVLCVDCVAKGAKQPGENVLELLSTAAEQAQLEVIDNAWANSQKCSICGLVETPDFTNVKSYRDGAALVLACGACAQEYGLELAPLTLQVTPEGSEVAIDDALKAEMDREQKEAKEAKGKPGKPKGK